MYLEVNRSNNGQFFFVIKSNGNNRTLATSELYVNRGDALHAARIVGNTGPARVIDNTAS